jgi:hypothetical protein
MGLVLHDIDNEFYIEGDSGRTQKTRRGKVLAITYERKTLRYTDYILRYPLRSENRYKTNQAPDNDAARFM